MSDGTEKTGRMVSCKVPDEIYFELQKLADKEWRSMNGMIIYALSCFLARLKEQELMKARMDADLDELKQLREERQAKSIPHFSSQQPLPSRDIQRGEGL